MHHHIPNDVPVRYLPRDKTMNMVAGVFFIVRRSGFFFLLFFISGGSFFLFLLLFFFLGCHRFGGVNALGS